MKKRIYFFLFSTLLCFATTIAQTVNTSTSIDWAFDLGIAGQTATYASGTQDYFGQDYVTVGSNLGYNSRKKATNGSIYYTAFQPVAKSGTATDNDYVCFVVKPKTGLTFTPTNIEFDCMRFGTGGGKIHVKWKSTDGTITTLTTDVIPERDNVAPYAGTRYVASNVDFSSITASDGECMLMLQLYSLDNTKQVGFANVKIEGTITGELQNVTTYSFQTVVSPENAGAISMIPYGNEFDEGTALTLTATPEFGYGFLKWIDDEGTELSTQNPYELTLDKDMTVTAVFVEKNIYSLSVNTSGGANDYLVSATPAGTIKNGITYYEEGTQIKLNAANNKIMTFTNWSDNSTESEKIFTITENVKLTANYSAADFIVGWDMYQNEPKQQRAADYCSDSQNAGMLSMRKVDGTTAGWLAKGEAAGGYEGRNAAVNWQQTFGTDKYYYEISFSTVGYANVKVSAAMLYNYNAYSVQKVEYSTDGENFTSVGQFTFATAKTWYDEEFELPAAVEEQAKVYVRFIPDYTSEVKGTTSNNDGTAITDIFVTADSNSTLDEVAPVLVSSLPENEADGISTSGSIVLTFDERVVKGTGDATLNGEDIEGVFSGKTVVFKYAALSHNTPYTFVVPAGFITDRSGNAFEGCEITFTTREKAHATARLFDAVVATDGSGDYLTVSEAITAAPENRVAPWLVFIKEGTYKEHLEIPANKPYIHLIGQDVEKVIITDNRLSGDAAGQTNYHVSQGATVVVQATDFFAENISFENSWGIEKNAGPQALAFYSNNDRIVLSNCKLRSYQDTYLTSTKNVGDRHYLKNCFIEGAVDFIYGGGDVFFDDCTLYITRSSGGYIVAPSHKTGTAWGYVFMNNKITAPAPANGTSVWLGRPWKDAPKTVFINTTSEVTIPAAGWYYKMGAIPAVFADYNTMDADGNLLDLSHRIEDYEYDEKDASGNVSGTVKGKAKKSLTDEEAAQYTIKNVLSGTDSWQPQAVTEKTAQPKPQVSEHTVSWEKDNYAICYIVYKDGKVADFTTENQYTVSLTAEQSAQITVQAVAESGALSEMSDAVQVPGAPTKLDDNDDMAKLNYYTAGGYLHIKNIPAKALIEVYSLLGHTLSAQKTSAKDINMKIEQNCIVRIVCEQGTTSFKVIK